MSQRELVSVSEANRPSIDQMLPTRYSQLLLDSQRQSSTNKNRQVNLLMLTPTGGSSSYLTRKKRLLDEHLGGDHSGTSKMQRSNAPPFERPSSGLESIDYRHNDCASFPFTYTFVSNMSEEGGLCSNEFPMQN